MKANELRIGNLIYYSSSESIWDVDLDFFHDLVSGGFEETDLYPIDLTEEWLIKFGFVKEKTGWFVKTRGSKKTNNLKRFYLGYFNNYSNQLGYNTKGGCMSGHKSIKYVHELQNLYFVLTGQELTYTSNTSKV